MAALHSFPGVSQWLHEKRVAYSCWAAPVLHRIPEHLTAVLAADGSAAPMAKTLTQRVRDARACGVAVEFGFSDQKDTIHLPFREDVTGHRQLQVGLLAPGSTYSRPLPGGIRQWLQPLSSPVTVAGPRRILTGFPGFHEESPPATRQKKLLYSNNQHATYRSGIRPPRTCRA